MSLQRERDSRADLDGWIPDDHAVHERDRLPFMNCGCLVIYALVALYIVTQLLL